MLKVLAKKKRSDWNFSSRT